MIITPEIEELKNLVEQKYGKLLGTSNDFATFSQHLMVVKHLSVSPSTLKRLWGYVNDEHEPRHSTLDMLAQYLGYESFRAFTLWLKTSSKYNSSFFNASMLLSKDVGVSQIVEIGWRPNRIVRLRYLGDSLYEVLTSENSKFCPGDRFITGCFIKEQPLYLPFLERGGQRTPPFVAGRNGGLTVIHVETEKQ